MLLTKVSKCCWKVAEFLKILVKIKTFYEDQTASRFKEVIQPPPPLHLHPSHQIKASYVSGKRYSYGDIQEYTDIYIPSTSRLKFRLEMVHHKCSFLTPTRNMFVGKFVKYVSFLTVLLEYFFIMFSELRFVKQVRLFE